MASRDFWRRWVCWIAYCMARAVSSCWRFGTRAPTSERNVDTARTWIVELGVSSDGRSEPSKDHCG